MKTYRMPTLLACLAATSLLAATVSAQEITYSSSWSSRPIVRVAQDYVLAAGEIVSDVRVVFGNATIDGQVDGDIVVVFGTARLGPSAVVDGSVVVVGGSAYAGATTSVRRDLVVVGGTLDAPAPFSPGGEHVVVGSQWLGGVLSGVVPWITRGLIWGRLIVPDLPWVWTVVGVFFLIYLAMNVVFDRAVGAAADAAATRPLSMFMTGLLVLLLSLPAIAIVAASVIGLALVPFIICALIVAGLLGKAAVLRAIGRSIVRTDAPESRPRAIAAFAIGFALLTLAYLVPVLGFMTWALATVLGFGAATSTLRAMMRKERPERSEPQVQHVPHVPYIPPVPAAVAAPVEPMERAERVEPPFAVPVVPRAASGLAQYPRATFLDRLAAFAIDAILVAIICELLDWNRHEGTFPMALLAYHIAFWAWKGTTLGGIICSLRVIRTHGAELRPADAIIRGLTSVLSLAALGIGCFWMLWDPQQQTWHDKIAGTFVVKVPRDLVLP